MILVTAASHAESMWVPRLPDVRRLVTGMGRIAEEALVRFLDEQAPGLIVGTGFCGGLSGGVAAGTVIVGQEVDFDGERIKVDRSLVSRAEGALEAARLPFRLGRIVTVNTVIRSPKEKEDLARGGAIAVDMESGLLLRAARRAGIDFLPLRVVLDTSDKDLLFVGDRADVLRAIVHPITTLRLMQSLIIAGRAIGRAVAAIVGEFAARRGECAAS
jgi:adenosylhomocysteine nucleosidase